MKTQLLAYSSKSKGAIRLAEALGISLIARDGSSPKIGEYDIVINWGNSSKNLPAFMSQHKNMVNITQSVDLSVDKLATFNTLKASDINIPKFTLKKTKAEKWLQSGKVVARMDKRGMRGLGMQILSAGMIIPNAELYTKFFYHEAEIRIHVAFGKAIEFHDKTAAGFNGNQSDEDYCISDEQQRMLSSFAVDVIDALGLDFGAVDFLWDAQENDFVVLEVNTAPEMKDDTLKAYVEAFKSNLIFNEEENNVRPSNKTSKKSKAVERVEEMLENNKVKKGISSGSTGKASSPKTSKDSGKSSIDPKVSKASGKTTPKVSDTTTSTGGGKTSGKSSESVGANTGKVSSGKTSGKTSTKTSAKVLPTDTEEAPTAEYADEACGDEILSNIEIVEGSLTDMLEAAMEMIDVAQSLIAEVQKQIK